MKKRGLFAALIMALVLACTWAQEPNSEDDFDWKVNDDFTEITITQYKGTRKDVVIPASIQDVPVVCIEGEAFVCAKISSIVIPDSVKTIRRAQYSNFGTFYKSGLESVILPEGISIWGGAFSNCEKLVSVTLGENTEIGGSAFYGCESLERINIPKGCTLYESAFAECKKLASVTLPENLKIIPKFCFNGCYALTGIGFPSTVKYIGEKAFFRCPLESVNLPEGLELLGYMAFRSDKIVSVSIPKSLKWIVSYLDYPYYEYTSIISGNNIADITIAEGCSPKVLDVAVTLGHSSGNSKGLDGRDLIEGASIGKSIKLQKLLASWKLQDGCYATEQRGRYSGQYNDYDFTSGYDNANGEAIRYKFTEEGKVLYADLLSYGFSEKEAQSFCTGFRARTADDID